MTTLVTDASTRDLFAQLLSQGEEWIVARALDVVERHLIRTDDGVKQPADAETYFRLKLAGNVNEVFAGLFLDNHHRVIDYEELFRGTIHSAAVHTRVVVQRALHYNAAALIVAHNHPSGDVEPSMSDRAVTEELQTALRLVDVRLLDHFVVGGGTAFSFAREGLL